MRTTTGPAIRESGRPRRRARLPEVVDLRLVAALGRPVCPPGTAENTRAIGLATAVLVPTQRSVVTMASSIATVARMSGNRFRACFGTGFTAQYAVGQRPMSLKALSEYIITLRAGSRGRQ